MQDTVYSIQLLIIFFYGCNDLGQPETICWIEDPLCRPVFLVMLGTAARDPNCTCSTLIPSGEEVGNESFICGDKFLNSTISRLA